MTADDDVDDDELFIHTAWVSDKEFDTYSKIGTRAHCNASSHHPAWGLGLSLQLCMLTCLGVALHNIEITTPSDLTSRS